MRLAFFTMMLVKGITYGLFGVRTAPEHPPVAVWEQGVGVMLALSAIVVLGGLFIRDGWDRALILRWGYLAFGIASAIFALGSIGDYGLDGAVAALINVMFAYAGFHDARAEDKIIKAGVRK